MDAMVSMLKNHFQMDRRGGRVHVLDDMRTCYVYDVYKIDREILQRLANMSHIEIQSESTSLSGYIMKISLKPKLITKVFSAFILMGAMCGVNYYLITQPPYKNISALLHDG